MDAFPFSEAEWATVVEASRCLTNATLADDEVLSASCLVALKDVLSTLRERYGEHPVLLETEADFIDNAEERIALYETALRASVAHGLPTLSIRISYAAVLLDLGRSVAAMGELLAGKDELASADEYEQKQWRELLAKAGKPEPSDGAGSR
jgi:hypothetical protein